jgi:DNA-binding winged helix-turn-helix (wHTH) protein
MELTSNGVTVPLGSRAAEVLLFVLRNAGNTAHKDALLAAIWPDRVVEENNLTVHMVARLRSFREWTRPARRFVRRAIWHARREQMVV